MTDTVALYLRLSPRPDGQYEGVDRQEAWGRAYAERTWPGLPVRVFADTGISAANGDHRPEYERLRDAIARREVTQLWTVEQSRLERTEVGWFVLAAELADVGITEVHTDRDGIVRIGDDAAGIKAVLNAGEVRRLRRRVNDALDSLAAQGRPGGGKAFGYRHGRDDDGRSTLVVVADQAEAIRWAADRVLAGWTLAAIAREFDARGLPTRLGGRWLHSNVKSALTNATVAGYRVHRGEIVGRGTWEPILDQSTWRAVTAALARPERRKARRYLLSGVARCGRCGAGLTGRMQGGRAGRRPIYFCASSTGGCDRLGVNAEPLEAHVVGELLAALDRPEFWRAFAEDNHEARRSELADALEAIAAQQVELAKRWAAKELPTEAWDAARGELDQRKRTIEADLAAVPAPTTVADPAAITSGWGKMTLEEKRAILTTFIASVVVEAARPGAKAFDPERVTITWA